MDSYLMFLNCPAYMDKDGAARCGLPAEVHCRYTMNSTDGPLESAKISCPRGHHFNGPIDCLTVPEQPTATAVSASPPPTVKAPNRAPDGRENDHNTAGMGQLPAGPAVPAGLGRPPAADDPPPSRHRARPRRRPRLPGRQGGTRHRRQAGN